jgi:hypothetical protein
MGPIMLDARGIGQLALARRAAHAGRVSDDGDIEEVLDVGRDRSGPAWLSGPGRYLRRCAQAARRVPPTVRWAVVGAAAVGLFGYGAAQPTPHPATSPAPSAPTAPGPAAGTASHYPGLLQEYDEQRAAAARTTLAPRHFGHRLR